MDTKIQITIINVCQLFTISTTGKGEISTTLLRIDITRVTVLAKKFSKLVIFNCPWTKLPGDNIPCLIFAFAVFSASLKPINQASVMTYLSLKVVLEALRNFTSIENQ